MIRQLSLTPGRLGLHEITDKVQKEIASSGCSQGLATLFVRHTSASLIIQENADPSAQRDMEEWMNRLVPEDDDLYTHTEEGPDDMPSHIRSFLTSTSLSIPILDGRLALGTWQGIFLWEHRRGAKVRHLVLHIAPD